MNRAAAVNYRNFSKNKKSGILSGFRPYQSALSKIGRRNTFLLPRKIHPPVRFSGFDPGFRMGSFTR
jgi:hypothetical protein